MQVPSPSLPPTPPTMNFHLLEWFNSCLDFFFFAISILILNFLLLPLNSSKVTFFI